MHCFVSHVFKLVYVVARYSEKESRKKTYLVAIVATLHFDERWEEVVLKTILQIMHLVSQTNNMHISNDDVLWLGNSKLIYKFWVSHIKGDKKVLFLRKLFLY